MYGLRGGKSRMRDRICEEGVLFEVVGDRILSASRLMGPCEIEGEVDKFKFYSVAVLAYTR
jgi:hypothetical protein